MRDVDDAVNFLNAFEGSQAAMARAADALLKVSKLDMEPDQKRQYDHMHKRMKHIIREWNKIEHERELRSEGGIPIYKTQLAEKGIKGLATREVEE